MPRCLPVLAALLCSTALVDDAAAQVVAKSQPVRLQAPVVLASGVIGMVTDEVGQGIGGVSVLAMGSTLAVVRTDERGRFRLDLAPGPYVLRATRDGYVSTYREAIQVRGDAHLTRTITLLSVDSGAGDIVLASMTQPAIEEDADVVPDDSPSATPAVPSETAWRLRHLARTALRDADVASTWREDYRPAVSSSTLALADFRGQVNFLTTSALTASGDLPGDDWPRGVAYVVLGAPVGRHGDWHVRASLAGGESSAWTVSGEYASRTDRPHSFTAGVAYSAQTLPDPAIRHSLAAIDTVRRVGGVHVTDSWTVGGRLEVDSALRIERYDYLTDPTLVSLAVGLRHRLVPRIYLVAAASPHKVAPGADQFAPPASAGVWLPAERTFSALNRAAGLRSQDVQSYDAGVDTVLGRAPSADADVLLRVRRFSERSANQIATLFGLDEASQIGHYYIASPGDVTIDGWLIGISGPVSRYVTAAVDYRTTDASWQRAAARSMLRRAERSAARAGFEQTHDVTAIVDATVPSTSTLVNVAVRVNSAFSRHDAEAPGLGTRFAVEVRQQLPGSPIGRGDLNLLLSARTLLHELETAGGFYNELLTVAPPVRLTCGLQMRF